jgi:hypothetical protein
MNDRHIPEFFLKEELKYYLKNNLQIMVTVPPPEEGTWNRKIITQVSIEKEHICSSETVMINDLPLTVKFNKDMEGVKCDVGNLIHHLLDQQKRIEALEKHLSQFTTAS